ncbi:MAG TPA: hypothetical protein VHC22_26290 [Pirellulales bacterium]|nr:hypothetical protein [Pirellulales bacterium]
MAHRLSCPRGPSTAPTKGLFPAVGGLVVGLITLAVWMAPATAADPSLAGDTTQVAASSPDRMATPPVGRLRDELWVVSCRGAASARPDGDLDQLSYSVHQPATGWTGASKEAFCAASPATTTCLLILGNGYSASETRTLGQTAYRRLTAGLAPDVAVRFVVWSWPSDATDAGPIKDLRIKASRTPGVAYSLARWLDEVPSPGRMSLLGTSFGARIVMEALELRASGQVGGRRLAVSSAPARPKLNVVLISAAIDNDWLLPGRRLGHALSQTDRLLLLNNSSDSTLKRYHWLYGPRSKTAALGTTGLRTSTIAAGEISQIDAAPIIGRHHGCAPYFESPRLVAAMRACLFTDDTASPQTPKDGIAIPVAALPDRARQ